MSLLGYSFQTSSLQELWATYFCFKASLWHFYGSLRKLVHQIFLDFQESLIFLCSPLTHMYIWVIGSLAKPMSLSLGHSPFVSYYDLSSVKFCSWCLVYLRQLSFNGELPIKESDSTMGDDNRYSIFEEFKTPLSGFQIKYVQFQLTIFSGKLTPSPHHIL